MGTVIVEQFNPVNGYWNKLYEVDQNDFDPEEPITVDKYGGHYRTRLVGEEVAPEKFEVEEAVIEEPKLDIEEEIVEKPKSSRKKFFRTFDDNDGEID